MAQKNDGGPAFPVGYGTDWPPLGDMTLRDWFAGQALAGICAYSGEGKALIDTNPNALANTAYIWADAMLAARDKD